MPPTNGNDFNLYIVASKESTSSILVQNNELGKEQVVYYSSRVLTLIEQRYLPIEMLCLSLYFVSQKLQSYTLPIFTYIVCEVDVIKDILSRPIIRGRIGKWSLALMNFYPNTDHRNRSKGKLLPIS